MRADTEKAIKDYGVKITLQKRGIDEVEKLLIDGEQITYIPYQHCYH